MAKAYDGGVIDADISRLTAGAGRPRRARRLRRSAAGAARGCAHACSWALAVLLLGASWRTCSTELQYASDREQQHTYCIQRRVDGRFAVDASRTPRKAALLCRLSALVAISSLAVGGAQQREGDDVADGWRVGEQHHEPVDADAETAGRRHAVLERE